MSKLSSGTTVQEFFSRCAALPDGFLATSSEARWRLGAVLMAECTDAIVVVRKAPVKDEVYEFAGRLTLPGGMVRCGDWPDGKATLDAEKQTRASLQVRAKKEAALPPSDLKELREAGLGPVVTSYTAKGRERFTVMVAYTCQVDGTLSLASSDKSIDEATWCSKIENWERLAPGNRLIIAHLLWSRLDASEQENARAPVQAAAKECSAWAESIGFPIVPVPWATSAELKAWRSGWHHA